MSDKEYYETVQSLADALVVVIDGLPDYESEDMAIEDYYVEKIIPAKERYVQFRDTRQLKLFEEKI